MIGEITAASTLAGVDRKLIHKWIAKGRKSSSGPFRDFADTVQKAMVENVGRRLVRIDQAGKGGAVVERITITKRDGTVIEREKYARPCWTADAWYLERRHWKKYGRRALLDVDASVRSRSTQKHVVEVEYVNDWREVRSDDVDESADQAIAATMLALAGRDEVDGNGNGNENGDGEHE